MHPDALKNIRRKVREILNADVVGGGGTLDISGWTQLVNLADLIQKQYHQWINRTDALLLVFGTISKSHMAEIPEGKTLKDFVDIEILSQQITSTLTSALSNYFVFFELPSFKPKANFSLKINDEIEIIELFKHEVFPLPKTLLGFGETEKKTYFLRVKVYGYCSPDSETTTIQNATGTAKAVLERLESCGFLKQAPRLILEYDARYNTAPGIAYQKIDPDRNPKAVEGELKTDFSRKINHLSAGDLKSDTMPIVKLFSQKSELSNTIISACEWAFDASADENKTIKVVKICVGLESLYGDKSSEGGITKSLTDRCAYSLARTHTDREQFETLCRSLYTLRSKIVHGVKRRLEDRDELLLEEGATLLRSAISNEIALIRPK